MKGALSLSAVIVVMAIGFFLRRDKEESVVTPVEGAARVDAADVDPLASEAKAPEARYSPRNSGVVIGDADVMSQRLAGYRCGDAQPCDDLETGATSLSEAEWLAARGYPSATQEAALLAMGMSDLERYALQGDSAAQVIHGRKLIEVGKTKEGLAQLLTASLDGSVYASYQLSHVYATEPQLRDINESAAYLRLAFLQGDWKAARKLYSQYGRMDAVEMASVDRRAMRLYGGLLTRKVQTKRPVAVGARPVGDDGG